MIVSFDPAESGFPIHEHEDGAAFALARYHAFLQAWHPLEERMNVCPLPSVFVDLQLGLRLHAQCRPS